MDIFSAYSSDEDERFDWGPASLEGSVSKDSEEVDFGSVHRRRIQHPMFRIASHSPATQTCDGYDYPPWRVIRVASCQQKAAPVL